MTWVRGQQPPDYGSNVTMLSKVNYSKIFYSKVQSFNFVSFAYIFAGKFRNSYQENGDFSNGPPLTGARSRVNKTNGSGIIRDP